MSDLRWSTKRLCLTRSDRCAYSGHLGASGREQSIEGPN